MNLQLIKQESFNNVLMDVYRNDNNEVFMTIAQLATALEYASKSAIEKMVQRNEYLKDTEFSATDILSAPDGKEYETRIFTEDGIYEVTMLSKQPKALEFRHFVRQLLKGLRKGEVVVSTVQPNDNMQSFEMQMIGAKYLAEMLRMDETSKLKLTHNVYKECGLPTNSLPQYVDEEVTRSATDLLKQRGKPMSAIKFNNKMIALGLLELKERPSSNGGTKEFKSLTDEGLRYGKNLVSQHNTKETQPHYYESKFAELLEVLKQYER